MKLSPHFTLEEFTYSQTAARLGIDNLPTPEIIEQLKLTAKLCEDIRALTGHPIFVSSGYRCPALNKAVGGASKSQHMLGEAADIRCPAFGSPRDLALLIEKHKLALKIDQVILEFGQWVHVSQAKRPRFMALTIRSSKEGYLPGIV